MKLLNFKNLNCKTFNSCKAFPFREFFIAEQAIKGRHSGVVTFSCSFGLLIHLLRFVITATSRPLEGPSATLTTLTSFLYVVYVVRLRPGALGKASALPERPLLQARGDDQLGGRPSPMLVCIIPSLPRGLRPRLQAASCSPPLPPCCPAAGPRIRFVKLRPNGLQPMDQG